MPSKGDSDGGGGKRFQYWMVFVNTMFMKTIPATSLEDAMRKAELDYPGGRIFVEPDFVDPDDESHER